MSDQVIKITCPDTKFYADALKGYQEVFAKCGPTQYRSMQYLFSLKIILNSV